MKKEATNQLQQRNVRFVSPSRLVLAAGSVVLLTLTPLAGLHAQINGTINGTSASAIVGDDLITVSTINIGSFNSCYFIANGITSNAGWGNNYVFAGQGPASGVANISSSDFTVSGYGPWIGTSSSTFNYLTLPTGEKAFGDALPGQTVNNAEAGGTGMLLTYTPKNGDPTNINFVQAYIESINGSPFSTGTIDGSNATPFYNVGAVGGTGTTRTTGSPLGVSATSPGWIADQPYDNEYGTSVPGADDTITNTTVTFQTFVEAQMNIGGTNYNVMFGGVQWGYSFAALDAVPEPGSVALATAGVLTAGFARRYRRLRRKNSGRSSLKGLLT
jgi:hypothetical protein